MKTAMQELISDLTYHIKTQSSEWKKDPVAMLHQIDAMYFGNAIEKEKQQIMNSWMDGKENKQFGYTIFDDAEKYFNYTFNDSHKQ